MSGINVKPVTAKATLYCDKCGNRWESRLYEPQRWGDEVPMIREALAVGWRIYMAGRGQRTYCPSCAPSKPMRLVHGTDQSIGGAS
ncbi:hypothetical protein [Microbacterium gorillae]|uniref:hypothetical protein n=1 Tax=Microbacterium gorillae TaxID=1231063 RepID=UPI003D9603C7